MGIFIDIIFLLGSEDVLQSFHRSVYLFSSNIFCMISFLLMLASSSYCWKNIDVQTIGGILTIFIGISMCSLVYILVVLYLLLEMVVKNFTELSVARVRLLIRMDTFSFLMFLVIPNSRLIGLCFHIVMRSE